MKVSNLRKISPGGGAMFNDKVWIAGKAGSSALAKRFEAVANNIANVNTPGYKRQEVTFEEDLRSAIGTRKTSNKLEMETTEKNHFGNSGNNSLENFQVNESTVDDSSYRLDGNNVDPEIEMAKLAETRMAYQGIMKIMARRVEMIRTAMNGG